jgi:hypothetical protein
MLTKCDGLPDRVEVILNHLATVDHRVVPARIRPTMQCVLAIEGVSGSSKLKDPNPTFNYRGTGTVTRKDLRFLSKNCYRYKVKKNNKKITTSILTSIFLGRE